MKHKTAATKSSLLPPKQLHKDFYNSHLLDRNDNTESNIIYGEKILAPDSVAPCASDDQRGVAGGGADGGGAQLEEQQPEECRSEECAAGGESPSMHRHWWRDQSGGSAGDGRRQWHIHAVRIEERD
jgi:hypothetical protein